MAVVFDSKESYRANAEDPAQDQRFRQLQSLLASEPEWHDGEVMPMRAGYCPVRMLDRVGEHSGLAA